MLTEGHGSSDDEGDNLTQPQELATTTTVGDVIEAATSKPEVTSIPEVNVEDPSAVTNVPAESHHYLRSGKRFAVSSNEQGGEHAWKKKRDAQQPDERTATGKTERVVRTSADVVGVNSGSASPQQRIIQTNVDAVPAVATLPDLSPASHHAMVNKLLHITPAKTDTIIQSEQVIADKPVVDNDHVPWYFISSTQPNAPHKRLHSYSSFGRDTRAYGAPSTAKPSIRKTVNCNKVVDAAIDATKMHTTHGPGLRSCMDNSSGLKPDNLDNSNVTNLRSSMLTELPSVLQLPLHQVPVQPKLNRITGLNKKHLLERIRAKLRRNTSGGNRCISIFHNRP